MIEDSIKAVKAAEEKADAMLREARKQADAIILKAQADAGQIVRDAGESGRLSAAEELERARAAGESVLAEAEKEAAAQVDLLKKETSGKIGSAIDQVISGLI